MDHLTLLETNKSGVITLWLNRPERRNALNGTLIQELTQHLNALAADPSVRILVLRGKGSHFCAGADLQWMKAAAEQSYDTNLEEANQLATLLSTLETFPTPTLAYAHGGVFGGGLGLLACCDIVVAAPKTLFSFSEVKLGLVPAVISPYVLRRIGEPQAQRYFLTAEQFEGPVAEDIGLVHQLATPAQSDKWITYFADHFLAAGPEALKGTKDLLHRLRQTPEAEKRELTAQTMTQVRQGDEAQAGLQAFFDKKPPPWREDGGDV